MNYIRLKARAKINLTLDVINKRADGYHNIETIMQTVELWDDVFIKKINFLSEEKIKISTNISWVPTDERNIAYKAAKAVIEKYNIPHKVFIELTKNIPVSAGLAGGSSDAAAVLFGLNRLFELNISDSELSEIGRTIGADVPFCLARGTYLATGIGEKLTRLSPCPKGYIVICKPSAVVHTSNVYGRLALENIKTRPNTSAMINAIENNDIKAVAKNLCNVLETVTAKEYPIINEIKSFMLEKGALGAIMSGSGPSVFGLFTDKEAAHNCAAKLKSERNIRETYVSAIFNAGYSHSSQKNHKYRKRL